MKQSMFNKLSIENFRGIKYFQLEDLAQINLFFGKNNCGKSSILEAVFLLTGLSNPLLPIRLNQARDYDGTENQDMLLDFYQLNKQNLITIHGEYGDGTTRRMQISVLESVSKNIDLLKHSISDVSNQSIDNFHGLKVIFFVGDDKIERHEYKSEIIISEKEDEKDNVKVHEDSKYKEEIYGKYLTSKYSFSTSVESLKKIVTDKQEQPILQALQQLEPKIKDFILVGNEVMVDVGLTHRIPINMIGDGVRKILSVIVAIYECKNGILLIDEIDNGLHYTSMQALWSVILESARLNNTQVFATTHNVDSLKGLQQVLLKNTFESMQQRVASYKLLHLDTDELKAVTYRFEQFNYVLEQEIEIR